MEWRVMMYLLSAEYPLHLLIADVQVGGVVGNGLTGCQKNSVFTPEFHWSVCLEKRENTPAWCSKRPFSKAAASEEARRTLRYVEPLSDAKTMLAGFFSILLSLIGESDHA
jgi:hypothetical protein